jgi:hypothetical protein
MCDPTDGMVMIANNTFKTVSNMLLVVKTYDVNGKADLVTQVFEDVTPTTTKRYLSVKSEMAKLEKKGGGFLVLQLFDNDQKIISENTYWLPDEGGNYTALQNMPAARVQLSVKQVTNGKISVKITIPADAPVSFFNRLSLVDANSHERLLPVFYSDNYITVLPGETKTITIDYDSKQYPQKQLVSVSGWNLKETFVGLQP